MAYKHFWRTLETRAGSWSVYLVDRIEKDGVEVDGLTDSSLREVLICGENTAERIEEIDGHELVHVISAGTEVPLGDPHGAMLVSAEEYIAARAEADVWPLLRSLGVKFPKWPKGFRPKKAPK
jgi:hypothetical protein